MIVGKLEISHQGTITPRGHNRVGLDVDNISSSVAVLRTILALRKENKHRRETGAIGSIFWEWEHYTTSLLRLDMIAIMDGIA